MVQWEVFVNKNFASIRSLYFNNMNSIIHRVVNFQKTGRNSISVQDLAADETNVYLLISCMDKRILIQMILPKCQLVIYMLFEMQEILYLLMNI